MENTDTHANRIQRLIGAVDVQVRAAAETVHLHVDDPEMLGALADVLSRNFYDFEVDAAFEVPPMITITDCNDPDYRDR